MNNQFSLIALDLRNQPEGHILKTLKNQMYFFDKRYTMIGGQIMFQPEAEVDAIVNDLYGENIHIQAIVGKNGAGKTSMLDIIYRIINNLSFSMLTKGVSQLVSLYFIEDLYATLYYSLNDKFYCISCHGQTIIWSEVDANLKGSNLALYSSTWTKQDFSEKDLIEKSKNLFYAIVTNYSPQALVPNDYKKEIVSRYYKGKLTERDDTSWLPSLFHKNDGYLTPVCLAPYRDDNGAINMTKELLLTTYRLSSIFLYYHFNGENAHAVIDTYSFADIKYEYQPRHANEKFSRYNGASKKSLISASKSSIGKQILSLFGVLDQRLMSKCNVYYSGCEYLIAKVYSIVDTYQSYVLYKKLFFKRDTTTGTNEIQNGITSALPDPQLEPLLEKLITKLEDDKSHVTIKLRQVLYMLKYIKQCEEENNDYAWLTDELEKFSFKEYFEKVHNISISSISIEKLQSLLPPPIFDIHIELYQADEKQQDAIAVEDLSSGEKQLLFVLSTIVYHVLNLRSIAHEPDRVSYKNIFLILDEVEMCFHPDYQRQFISRLVNVLVDLKLNQDYSFYILIATHSPFILSDIPQRNILYLNKGQDVGHKITVNPFCANVNDILFQSFFLDHGFSGELATRRVKDLVSEMKALHHNNVQKRKSIKLFIDKLIGDPVLKDALLAMYNHKNNTDEEDRDK